MYTAQNLVLINPGSVFHGKKPKNPKALTLSCPGKHLPCKRHFILYSLTLTWEASTLFTKVICYHFFPGCTRNSFLEIFSYIKIFHEEEIEKSKHWLQPRRLKPLSCVRVLAIARCEWVAGANRKYQLWAHMLLLPNTKNKARLFHFPQYRRSIQQQLHGDQRNQSSNEERTYAVLRQWIPETKPAS